MTVLLERPGLVLPTWSHVPPFVVTDGPEVADVCAAAGFAPYPEQALVLDALFGVDASGRSAAFEVDVVAARQELKTGLIIQAILGWLFVAEQELVVYSAHNGKAVTEAFRKVTRIIKGSPVLAKRLRPGVSQGVMSGKGEESIELRSGQRVLFMVRTPDNARSLSGNKIVIDEAYAYTAGQSGALLPTLESVEDPQLLMASSAGKADSDQLRDARDRGRAGLDLRQGYFEWGDPDAWQGCESDRCEHEKTAAGCALDDEDRWRRIKPSLTRDPRRVEVVRQLRKSMAPKEFAREITVWWDDPATAGTLVLPKWHDRLIPDTGADEFGLVRPVEPPTAGLVVAVAVAVDQEWSSIAAAGRWETGEHEGNVHLGAVDRRPGSSWTVARLAEIQSRTGCAVVMDEKCPDAKLRGRLEAAGVEVHALTLEQVVEACSWLLTGVEDPDADERVTHFGATELDAAVSGAVKRTMGDRFVWGRRKSEADVSMLEAATLCGWGVSEGLSAGAFNIW